MNLNKGCIEIFTPPVFCYCWYVMNLNKGCIEINNAGEGRCPFLRWTLTRVVLKSVGPHFSQVFEIDEP